MTSQIDPTKPVDGVAAAKADLRSNLQAAKNEIEALQSGKSDVEHTHLLADIADAGSLASLSTVGTAQIDNGAVNLAQLAHGTPDTLYAKDASGAPIEATLGAGLQWNGSALEATGAAGGSIIAATPGAGVFLVSESMAVDDNVAIDADQAVDIQIPQNVRAGVQLDITCRSASVTLSIEGWADSSNGYFEYNGGQVGQVDLVNPGRVVAKVRENPGAAPVIEVLGGVDGLETALAGPLDASQARVTLGNYREVETALSISGGVVTLDWSLGNSRTLTLTADVTSITQSNVPASGFAQDMVIVGAQDTTGGRTLAIPAGWLRLAGSDTTVPSAANAAFLMAISRRRNATFYSIRSTA